MTTQRFISPLIVLYMAINQLVYTVQVVHASFISMYIDMYIVCQYIIL